MDIEHSVVSITKKLTPPTVRQLHNHGCFGVNVQREQVKAICLGKEACLNIKLNPPTVLTCSAVLALPAFYASLYL